MAVTYPAVTLWQPYASLVVDGHKAFETRPRPFPRATVGARVAIHSAKRDIRTDELPPHLVDLCRRIYGPGFVENLPRGMVLGTVTVRDVLGTEERLPDLDADQVAMGDWRSGRWSMALSDPVRLEPPVSAQGSQGWWRWTG